MRPGEAEYFFAAKKAFTKSTRHGCHMFSDLFVEITIKYIRHQLGHRVSGRDFEERVKYTVYFLAEIIKASNDIGEHRAPPPFKGASMDVPAKTAALSKCFIQVLRGIRETKVSMHFSRCVLAAHCLQTG